MENKNKYFIVYKTINLKNEKFYIGVHETYNINDGYLGSGKFLRNSIYYHGKENFKREILELCENKKQMYDKEREIITKELIKNPKCMNLVVGGVGFINDEKHRKISQLGGNATGIKLQNDPEFRKYHNSIVSENIKKYHRSGKAKYDTFTNKKHTDIAKKNMSIAHKGMGMGEKNSQFNTCWITKNEINKKIKNSDLSLFLQEGWFKGRKI